MQTFLPYPDFAKSAACLDNRRLGKQRVECLQILKTLSKESKYCHWCKKQYSECVKDSVCPDIFHHVHHYASTPWYNHPAVKMWRGKKAALALYGCHVCYEWRKRGFQDTVTAKICAIMLWTNDLEIELRQIKFDIAYPQYDYPLWLGNESFHASHRSNLLRKDPIHYSQFGWTEPNNLPYIWPV